METPYVRAKNRSDDVLSRIQSDISGVIPSDAVVVTCGSYARRESSDESDIDYFSVLPGTCGGEKLAEPKWTEDLDHIIEKIVPKAPSEDGAFQAVEYHDDMLKNIGGNNDTNAKISRRVLLLLEGEWLSNESGFKKIRQEILEHYIKDSITDHQLTLFLLNDIIRYYRTIAVDYEFKTEEASKPWAIRNIKLIFSRKLLYASGLFSVAMTADHAYREKISRLEGLFDLPVVDRMVEICGAAPMERVLSCYDHFLETIEKKDVRAHLNSLPKTKEGRDDEQFRRLKNEGHHFTRHILALFENTFGSVHPIRRAVIF